jgi:membrane fusion protein (multidrug efflux system)
LEVCQIRSPPDGFVASRRGNAGEFVRSAVSGGSSSTLTIAHTRVVRLVALMPDSDVPYVNVGDPAVFSSGACKTSFKGKVSHVAGVEDPTARAMRVEIDLENKDGRLRPGMRGWLEIRLVDRVEGFLIPSRAVGRLGGGLYCYPAIDGHMVRTDIFIAHQDGERTWVSAGLAEGDHIVADAAKIKFSEEVRPVPGGNPPPAFAKR